MKMDITLAVLILILLTVWLIACVFCAVGGFYLGKRRKPYSQMRATSEQAEEQIRKARRRELENRNMLSYDGGEQEDIVL